MITAWFEPFNASIGGTIVANDDPTVIDTGFDLYYASGGTSISGCVSGSPNGGCATINLASYHAAIASNNLYFTALEYNSTSHDLTLALYEQNGTALFATATGLLNVNIANGRYPLSIGFNPYSNGNYFVGTISDLRFYTTPSATIAGYLDASGPTSTNYAPDSLWLGLSGSFADQLGSGLTAVPVLSSSWQENLVTFVAEP